MKWARRPGLLQPRSGGVSACNGKGYGVYDQLRGPPLEISAAFSKWMGSLGPAQGHFEADQTS